MAKTRRPKGSTIMTQAEKDHIVEQIAAGRAVIDIAEDDEIKVGYRTINRELNRDPVFLAHYARAREAQIEPNIEEIEAILAGKGEWATVEWEVRKEIANNRRWNAIRLQRFRYGDKVDLDVRAKVQVEGKVIDAEVLDMDQLLAVREALQLAIEGPKQEEDEEYDEDVG